MNILQINKFLYPKGGADIHALDLGDVLTKHGHQVYYWGMNHPKNPEYAYEKHFVSYVDYEKDMGFVDKVKTAAKILYCLEAKMKLDDLLKEIKPDIIHLNNIAHQISPSILDTIKKYDIPTVMHLHDYKIVCPAYTLFSKGLPCEQCRSGYVACLKNKCIKDSRLKSMIGTMEMYLHHRLLKIYDKVDLFIAPSRFMYNTVRAMGFKGNIEYLPYFVDANSMPPSFLWEEQSIVFAGRLSYEKGLNCLIDAVKGVDIELKILGEGPMENDLKRKVRDEGIKNVRFLGFMTGDDLYSEIRKSMFLVTPSEWYEVFGKTTIEGFALGKPVIGARIGGITELVRDWDTGLTFKAGDSNDLKEKIKLLLIERSKIPNMGRNGRNFVETEFSPEIHYNKLIKIYERIKL